MSETTVQNMKPPQVWEFLQSHPDGVIIDVRTTCEHLFVGRPIGAILVPWKDGLPMQPNLHFVDQVKEHVPDLSTPVFLLCRSGHRSLEAGKVLAEIGYQTVVNIEEGFEGPLDENKHRGTLGGWRFHGLPWEQN
ncbi:MAG: sulfurtransferase [Methylothermaceae bacteria B42]|nr:MAG: sulfurtransferase [Methylothermaceae bacteria B42]HHJ39368.1 rhodanese-like domain-containing protein [Methylothermaceae bacterium]